MADQNTTTDVAALESAVQALTKAAGQTSLAKGGIENSGTTIDGKPGGGGQTSEFGALDDMMIGKMTAAGLDAGTIAMFGQYLAAKAGEEVDEDEEEEAEKSARALAERERLGRRQAHAAPVEPVVKSTMEQFREDPVIADNVDVSEYLEQITVRVAEQLDGVRKSMGRESANQRGFNAAMAQSMVAMATLVKSQSRIITEMGSRLGIVERAPVTPPKGATSQPRARALNKSMGGNEVGGGEVGPLRKSELLGTLSYLNLEKGIKHINGVPTMQLITLYEGGGVLDEGTVEFAKGWLAANPAESALAKSYA